MDRLRCVCQRKTKVNTVISWSNSESMPYLNQTNYIRTSPAGTSYLVIFVIIDRTCNSILKIGQGITMTLPHQTDCYLVSVVKM